MLRTEFKEATRTIQVAFLLKGSTALAVTVRQFNRYGERNWTRAVGEVSDITLRPYVEKAAAMSAVVVPDRLWMG